jgi:hypothetical protein
MRQNPQGWRYGQVARILEAYGFATNSQGGSHRFFKHPSGARTGLVESGSGALLPVYVKKAITAIDQVGGNP